MSNPRTFWRRTMLACFRQALTLVGLLATTLALAACVQMQIPDDPLDPRRPQLERLVYEFGPGGKGYLQEKMRNTLESLARNKEPNAFVSALSDIGASCMTARGKTSCHFARSQVNRSLGLMFPKYLKTTWNVTISYRSHARMVSDIEVDVIATPEFVPSLAL